MIPPHVAYKKLLSHFGRQGWWPVTPDGALHPEYFPVRYPQLSEKELFEICAGAILTQNTAWTNVEKALFNLHAAGVFLPADILSLTEQRLAELIRPSGYYNQKAARLRMFARHCETRGGVGALLSPALPAARSELLSLNGIGPETADSMLLYAGGRRIFVVDAYTLRLAARLGWDVEHKYDALQRYCMDLLPGSVKLYKEFHALIVALGKNFCRRASQCGGCPLAGGGCNGKLRRKA
ncbi:MAG: hypothetical protein A2219_07625 [Elusimicrobia bacterium RIFOXYA2_FULL_50_26]|nr:MAG: hypothetical protein A2219_07625 [Elusimicrobia bacterium RIFOXYA2_FULL_50_26]OGS24650.1 MAG: hypothetical protein A2314_05520 [Elusimicrobia bacterium RIFOXYB2_FULL_50_12]